MQHILIPDTETRRQLAGDMHSKQGTNENMHVNTNKSTELDSKRTKACFTSSEKYTQQTFYKKLQPKQYL